MVGMDEQQCEKDGSFPSSVPSHPNEIPTSPRTASHSLERLSEPFGFKASHDKAGKSAKIVSSLILLLIDCRVCTGSNTHTISYLTNACPLSFLTPVLCPKVWLQRITRITRPHTKWTVTPASPLAGESTLMAVVAVEASAAAVDEIRRVRLRCRGCGWFHDVTGQVATAPRRSQHHNHQAPPRNNTC